MIGKTLGHYQITGQLGKGGMGEVFQARDQVLGRDVAIKVLPEEFAKDADRIARFQREAKLLASLNHPNIAAIYGFEESEKTNFLVLELVEGDTLADRINSGPIPAEESLELALQITEALEAAHEKGIIHRDLKPANIKVTPDGKVKVLDFGLAKAFAVEQQKATITYSPTPSEIATQQGVILGTSAYMSPEQAKGRTVDKRTDVWAFGVVLYEMLTGGQLFASDTVLDTLAAVLSKEPDWEKVPARVRFLLRRCLQKNSNDRLRDIGDVKLDLKEIMSGMNELWVQTATAMEPRTRLGMMLPWLAVTAILSIIAAGVVVWEVKPPEPRQVTRFYYELPEGQQFGDLTHILLAVSADGRSYAYCTSDGIYVHSVDQFDAKLVQQTNDKPQEPFFSPDGRWIGYWSAADSQLKKIAVEGGEPVKLAKTEQPNGPIWDEDNNILYAQQTVGIMRISADRKSDPVMLISTPGEYLSIPRILPDKKTVMYGVLREAGFQTVVQSLESEKRRELSVNGLYLTSGHFLNRQQDDLRVALFDLDRLEVTGKYIKVLEGVFRKTSLGVSQFAISDSGTLIYLQGEMVAPGRYAAVWIDRKGKEEQLPIPTDYYRDVRISPDGNKVALDMLDLSKDPRIRIWDLNRENMRILNSDERCLFPAWYLDSKRILYPSVREQAFNFFTMRADGTGKEERVGSVQAPILIPGSWSPDGKLLLYTRCSVEPSLNCDIESMSMEEDHGIKRLLQEKYNEIQPQVSPDGRWMSYVSNESGQYEVYVSPFPGVDKDRWQASTHGGDSPLWSPDGRELFYRNGDAVMAVSVGTRPTFDLLKPSELFRLKGTYVSLNFTWGSIQLCPWDISLDGKRFLMLKDATSSGKSTAEDPGKINVVLNWFEELKQRIPVK